MSTSLHRSRSRHELQAAQMTSGSTHVEHGSCGRGATTRSARSLDAEKQPEKRTGKRRNAI